MAAVAAVIRAAIGKACDISASTCVSTACEGESVRREGGAEFRPIARGRALRTPTPIVETMPDTRALPHHETAWLGKPQPDDADVPTLVLLHGYGSHEKHLIALVPAIQMFLPGVNARVIAVRGSFPAPGRQHGFSWFPGAVTVQPSIQAIGETADRVAAVIRQYSARAMVLGFSQGM